MAYATKRVFWSQNITHLHLGLGLCPGHCWPPSWFQRGVGRKPEEKKEGEEERGERGRGGSNSSISILFSPLRALMTDDSLEISWQCAAIYYRLKLLSCFEDSIIRLVFSSIYLELSLSQQSTSPPNTTHQSMYPVVSLQPFRNVLFTLPHSQVN